LLVFGHKKRIYLEKGWLFIKDENFVQPARKLEA
jgi:hypothetical protein